MQSPITRLGAAALLALSIGHAPSAWADPTATFSASLTSIQIQVVDLDPFDGIAAGYTFVNPAGNTATLWSMSDFRVQSASQTSPQPFVAFDQSLAIPSTAQHVQGSADSLSVSGAALGRSGLLDTVVWINLGSSDLMAANASYLQLAPHTELRITAVAQADVALDLTCAGCSQDTVEVRSSAFIDTWAPQALREQVSVYTGLTRYGADPVATQSSDGQLVATLTNTDGSFARRGLQFSVGGHVTYYPSGTQTPEPGTYALVGLGLAAAGWQARRRRAEPA